MFDTLSDKLQGALGDLRGRGVLTEEDLSRAMREIRLALLEADVNFKVVKEFVARVRERADGAAVTKSLTPGQEVVRIVHEELTELMGSGGSKLAFSGRPPTVILLAGLQGAGKTTAAAKLALLLRKQEDKSPALVAADLQRPAAVDQLEQLGKQIQVPVYLDRSTKDAVAVARHGIEQAQAQGRDVVIVDTAGRLQIDEPLMQELASVRKAVKPHNILLVLDAMTGQEAVAVAEAFQERVDFDGVVLTKLDGDARGGAALSVKAVTGKPIKLASTGEKLDQLEYFHPDRMASRILGMGDVLTLIEKAEEAAEADEQEEMERRLRVRAVHLRGLPAELPDDAAHGPAQVDRGHDSGARQAAPGRRRRRPRAEQGRGDRPLDDRGRAPPARDHQRVAPRPDRQGERHDGAAGQPAAERAQADGKDGEADGAGQDAESAVDRGGAEAPLGNGRKDRMATRIRLARVGSKKNPIYRVVVADQRSPRDGRFIEIVGRYNPQTNPSTISLDADKIQDWIGKGAQPSDSVKRLMKAQGI